MLDFLDLGDTYTSDFFILEENNVFNPHKASSVEQFLLIFSLSKLAIRRSK